MPKVPEYNRQFINERNLNVQDNINYNEKQFGSAIGDGLEQVSKIADIYEKAKQEADMMRAKEALVKYKEQAIEKQTNPNDGLLNKTNADAIGLYGQFNSWSSGVKDSIGKNLTETQRGYFKSYADKADVLFQKSLNNHESKEIKNYEDNTFKSLIETSRENASFNFTNLDVVEQEIKDQEIEIYNYAKKRGLVTDNNKEIFKDMALTETSKTRRSVLEKLIDSQNIQSAEEYFKNNENKMTEKDSNAVRDALKTGGLAVKAQAEADKLFKMGSIEGGIKQANKIEDVELRDEVKKRLTGMEQELRQAEMLDRENNFQSAFNEVEANLNVYPKDTIGASRWSKLTPNERESLVELYNKKGVSDSTDPQVYEDLNRLMSNPKTRNSFKNISLMEYKPKLTMSDWKHFSDLQAKLRTGKDIQAFDGIESKNSIVNSALNEMGIKYTGKGSSPKTIERASNFRRQVDLAVVQKQNQLGRKLFNEEVRQITDSLSQTYITEPGFIFDRKKRAFELNDADQPVLNLKDIPEDFSINFENSFKKKTGRSPRKEETIQAYQLKLQKALGNE